MWGEGLGGQGMSFDVGEGMGALLSAARSTGAPNPSTSDGDTNGQFMAAPFGANWPNGWNVFSMGHLGSGQGVPQMLAPG